MRISMIAVIGPIKHVPKENITPLEYLPAHLKYFEETSTDKLLVMGRVTYENTCTFIGKPLGATLPGRKIIILSRTPELTYTQDNENLFQASSADDAIFVAYQMGADEMIVVGGESTHQLFFPLTDRLYITHVFGCFSGYQYFSKFTLEDWKVVSRNYESANKLNPFNLSFKVFDRTRQEAKDKKIVTLENFSL